MPSDQMPVAKPEGLDHSSMRLARSFKGPNRDKFRTTESLERILKFSPEDIQSGRYRLILYRFLTNQLPIISACIWTWVRLSSAPGAYRVVEPESDAHSRQALRRLEQLSQRIYSNALGNRVGMASLVPELFTALFRDGIFGTFLTVKTDGTLED